MQLAASLHRPQWLTLPSFLVKILFGQMGSELLLNGQSAYPQRLLALGYQFKHKDLSSVL